MGQQNQPFIFSGSASTKSGVPSSVANTTGNSKNVTGFGLSPENQAVVSLWRNRKTEFFILDRSERSWIRTSLPAPFSPADWLCVLGFDGTTLVATSNFQRMRRFKAQIASQQ